MTRHLLFPVFHIIFVAAFLGWFAQPAVAVVKPNGLFSNGAVLQRRISLPVWGSANDGEKITVTFHDQTVHATAKNGHWMVRLKPMEAGGPFIMTISGENTITLTNLLIGEVWLCSGQSNMEMPLAATTNAAEALAAANDPLLRVFTVPFSAVDEPKTDVSSPWKLTTPGDAKYFSAVAYYFGRDLRKDLNVPIGLIHSSVGGTPAEAWTPHETLAAGPILQKILDRQAEAVKNFDPAKAEAGRAAEIAKARADGKDVSKWQPVRSPTIDPNRPSGLYNGKIAPLVPFAIAGVIWYQGESNNHRAEEYRTLFPALIDSWRKAWDEGEIPFLFVQIAPHKEMTPEIREAQFLTWQKVPRTSMAVITDVGEVNDIHPKRKAPVGDRLALAARAIAYGENIEYSGPVYKTMKVKGGKIVLSFTHIGGGLVAKDGDLKGFTIADKNGNYTNAVARIDGKKIIVFALTVAEPTAVRFGWANVPDVNLFNQEGLPATPFRTDVK